MKIPSKLSRPVIRYHGAKWMLAPWIIQHFPQYHRRYVEPFSGGASVLMRKERSANEVWNDLDAEITNLFRVLRDRGAELRRLLELTPFARQEFEEAWQASPDPMEQARRVVIRSFMGFGSAAATENRPNGRIMTGFRGISDRSGTTPCHDWMNYPGCMDAMVERLRGVVIENRPALEVIGRYDGPDTLFYVDPPYVMASRDAGSDYRHEMTDEDHRELAAKLMAVKGKVLLSGYPSPLYDELYADWNRVDRAALADGARPRVEVLWMNYEPPMDRQGVLL